jgi:hypothetical protein
MTCNHVHSDPTSLLSLCARCGEVVTYENRQLRDDELIILLNPEWAELRRKWEDRQTSAT